VILGGKKKKRNERSSLEKRREFERLEKCRKVDIVDKNVRVVSDAGIRFENIVMNFTATSCFQK
jgi:hypothetical protein